VHRGTGPKKGGTGLDAGRKGSRLSGCVTPDKRPRTEQVAKKSRQAAGKSTKKEFSTPKAAYETGRETQWSAANGAHNCERLRKSAYSEKKQERSREDGKLNWGQSPDTHDGGPKRLRRKERHHHQPKREKTNGPEKKLDLKSTTKEGGQGAAWQIYTKLGQSPRVTKRQKRGDEAGNQKKCQKKQSTHKACKIQKPPLQKNNTGRASHKATLMTNRKNRPLTPSKKLKRPILREDDSTPRTKKKKNAPHRTPYMPEENK